METKTKNILIAGGIIIFLIAGYLSTRSGNKPSAYEFAAVKLGNITQEVNVTGSVKPAEDVSLSFETSGKISRVDAKIGDEVVAGQPLAGIDDSDAKAQLENAKAQLGQYQAAYEIQQAKLNEMKSGTRPEEIKIAETDVSNAKKTLSDAQINLENVKNKAASDLANLYGKIRDILNDAYVKADDAVNKQTDEMFSNDSTSNPQLTFTTADSQAKADAEQRRVSAGTSVKTVKTYLDNLSSAAADLDVSLVQSKEQLATIRDFLTRLNEALDSATNISLMTISTYKGYVNAGRTNVNTAITNITNHQQAIESQKMTNQSNISAAQTDVNSAAGSLSSAEDTLSLKKAGNTPEEINAQEAAVTQARANIVSQEAAVTQAETKLAKTVIRSPIGGIVTAQDAKIGQIIAANTPVASVISEKRFHVEANVAEADIAKVAIGNPADITLDAYGNDIVFEAEVIAVDPAETVIEGVSTYKTTLQFKNEDGRLKSGMTANINIITASRKNVITVPQRAVIKKGGEKFVLVDAGAANPEERKIETGIRGSDGSIEVTSGLREGEKVVISSAGF